MRAGDVVTLDDNALATGVYAFRNPALKSGDSLGIMLNTKSADGETTDQGSVQFTIRTGGLSSDEWLQADGSLTTDPCPIDE